MALNPSLDPSPGFRGLRVALGAAFPFAAAALLGAGAARQDDTREYVLLRDGVAAGTERVTTRRMADSVVHTTRTDLSAGPGVALEATLVQANDGAPRSVRATGKTFPWFDVVASWRAAGAAPRAYPVSGPFPVSHVAELVRHWRAGGRRGTYIGGHGGALTLDGCGQDTVRTAAGARALDCTEVGGLTWGRIIVWTDPRGATAAVYVPTVVGKILALAPRYASAGDQLLRHAALGAARMAARVPPAATAHGRPLVLRGGTLIDPATGTRTPDAVVVLSGDRIVAAGPAAAVRVPRGAREMDVRGAFVLPGLWDMHAHVRQAEWGPAYLAAGVTTARDLGNHLGFITELRRVFRSPGGVGPELLLAGWVDATDATSYRAYQANTPEAGRALVRRYKAAGFDQIKVWEYVRPEVLRAVTAEAHRAGLTVTGHVPQALTLAGVLDAGLDQINHSTPLVAAVQAGGTTPRALAAALRARGTVVDPTLVVSEFYNHRLGEPLSALEPGVAHVTPELARSSAMLRGAPSRAAAGEAAFAVALQVVGALHAAGVPIVAGSDQGVPGYSLLRELELYVMAGLSPLDAIRAATVVPARVMGRSAEYGRVAPGYRADLVVVAGDPTVDIRALRATRWVVRAGSVYAPDALRRAVGFRP